MAKNTKVMSRFVARNKKKPPKTGSRSDGADVRSPLPRGGATGESAPWYADGRYKQDRQMVKQQPIKKGNESWRYNTDQWTTTKRGARRGRMPKQGQTVKV